MLVSKKKNTDSHDVNFVMKCALQVSLECGQLDQTSCSKKALPASTRKYQQAYHEVYTHGHIQSFAVYEIRAAEINRRRAHTLLHTRAQLRLCSHFAPMSYSAPPRAPTLMPAAPDGTHHPLIDLCGESSEDEVAAGGLHDAFVEGGDALALPVVASEDD